jgi:hypothetical protein
MEKGSDECNSASFTDELTAVHAEDVSVKNDLKEIRIL